MLPDIRDYDALVRAFRWQIPPRYNIGVDVCDRWATAEPTRPAIVEVNDRWETRVVNYGELRDASNRLANALKRRGIRRGDRVAILLPQSMHVATAHIAIYKLGAVALPVAALFGADALSYRFGNAGVSALITNAAGVAKLRNVAELLPKLETVLSAD